MIIYPLGVHVTPGRFVFQSNDVGSQLHATRKVHRHLEQSDPTIAAATRAIGREIPGL